MNKLLVIILLVLFSDCLLSQEKPKFKGELGILEEVNGTCDTITIYNEDESVWLKFNILDEANLFGQSQEEIDKKSKIPFYGFRPYFYDLKYTRFFFRVFEVENGKYKIEVDNGKFKYIKAGGQWKLRNWGEHIVKNVAMVGFDAAEIKIYEKPDENSKIIANSEKVNPQIYPVDSKGDWLKISFWFGENEMTGWIKWKDKDYSLIELFYHI